MFFDICKWSANDFAKAAGQDYEKENLTKGIEVSWCYLYRNKRSTEFLGIEVAVSNCISFYVLQHQYQCPSSYVLLYLFTFVH
ncbi:hypothetical protein ES332_A13G066300v1 [Gossypium tomentosum]|uniref:Uncharacterized protein n=1 Tax=Gossypium tomentosum TaxID=34277 RepID=A0A5D2MGV8_GOSTO|nr:hypothetical protein ES332_A13G066300v1 [Gossypium tomentosum]